MSLQSLRIATRNSPLALCQAEQIKLALLNVYPDLSIQIIGFTTEGDIHLNSPLYDKGGKGLFVKELELALLEKNADIAVHSIKDLPSVLPEGLKLGTICKREDPRDAFISNSYDELEELPLGAKIGTSSLRRQCQLKIMRPDLNVIPLRGNVQTRLKRLDDGEFAAIVLAAAGLHRLKLYSRISAFFAPEKLLPAVGQGALGIEIRSNDLEVEDLLRPLDDQPTRYCVTAERAFNFYLEGGCHAPIAGYATLQDEQLSLRGLVSTPDGSQRISGYFEGFAKEAEGIGKSLAEELLKQGAKKILEMGGPNT